MSQEHTDTFASFVGWVETHLDDHDRSAVDVASDHYLSRYHFDRVIQAASGESPGEFKRRILLERAAYRLATSREGVLEIAVEAGYGSNEAFTRAFRRAYGATPSAWRSAPRQIQLTAPNRVHFQPPGSLRLPARPERKDMESSNLLVRMIEHHVWLIGELAERATHLDDTSLDRPIQISVEGVDDDPTMRSLLSRLVGQMDMWNAAIAAQDYDWSVEDHESITSIRARLKVAGPAFLALAREVVDEGRLDETFVDALCEPAQVFTYGGLFAHVLTFAAHRRLLVLGALASAGITDLGNGDPRDWVSDAA